MIAPRPAARGPSAEWYESGTVAFPRLAPWATICRPVRGLLDAPRTPAGRCGRRSAERLSGNCSSYFQVLEDAFPLLCLGHFQLKLPSLFALPFLCFGFKVRLICTRRHLEVLFEVVND